MKPLKGVRVVSLALNLPGPAALMRCRALGAICIKVEPSTASGDPMRSYNPAAYAQMHEGIRTLSCDLKSASGQTKLAKELAKADVLLTSFRPSALKRLGLDWDALRKCYPKLSQVAIVGGEGDAAEVAGHDLTYLAENGLVRGLDLPGTLFADMAGSLLTVEAILSMALQAKMAGKPQYIRVALSGAAKYLALPRSWGLTSAEGSVGGAHAGYQVYPCKDGRAAVAALEPHFAASLCVVAGLKDTANKADMTNRAVMMSAETKAHMKRWFVRKTCAQLDELAAAHDLPIYAMPDTVVAR